ncbi:MAG: DUF1800 domain-containing protein [Pseudonocardiales bacterium]|nr:MAG: DUF1800 domain-containing protein [Pseudonocardiales bacterium]
MTLIWPSVTLAVANARRTAQVPLVWDPVGHVLSRMAFGPTAGSRAEADHLGISGWYHNQLAAGTAYRGYSGHAGVAAQGPLLSKSPWEVRQYLKSQNREFDWDAMDQLARVTLGLQTWSSAQVYETLVDFFSNHLNVANHNGDVWNTRHAYDRDVIRRHAMGSFTDMLLASARHPAMLTYLNLAESSKIAINENYGRELLELHTVGLIYSEDDVKNASRLLTGRTIDGQSSYAYQPRDHYTGVVRVLGFAHANASAADGEPAGDALIRYLAKHPATAQRLATKLCVRYVSDHPSAALVSAVAHAYLANGTNILPMMTAILHSTEFWQSRGAKVRRPTENLIATVRILGPAASNMAKALDTLNWMSTSTGQLPLDWPTPDGYPDVAGAWRSSSTLLSSWTQHLGFAGDWWEGFAASNKSALYGRTPVNSGEAITLLTRRLTGMTFSAAHRALLQTFLDEPASTLMANSRLRWLLAPLIAIILDGPHHALR